MLWRHALVGRWKAESIILDQQFVQQRRPGSPMSKYKQGWRVDFCVVNLPGISSVADVRHQAVAEAK